MDKNLKNNKLIAEFMGWEIIQLPINEDFPNQRWFKSVNKELDTWCGGKGTFTDKPNFEQDVERIHQELWHDLINPKYGRAVLRNWENLMKVVEKIEKLGFDRYDVSIDREVTVISDWRVNIQMVRVSNAEGFDNKFDRTHEAIVKFIKKYNKILLNRQKNG